MRIAFVISFFVLSGCVTTLAGYGETSTGRDISGTYTTNPINAQSFQFDVSFVTGGGQKCTASNTLPTGEHPWQFPVSCSGDISGTASLIPDYAASEDTVSYQLSNGERGSLVFAPTQPSTQAAQANAEAVNALGYSLGCALAGGGCRGYGADQPSAREFETDCVQIGNRLRCTTR